MEEKLTLARIQFGESNAQFRAGEFPRRVRERVGSAVKVIKATLEENELLEGYVYRTPTEKAQAFIMDNFKNEISLERLALEANLSKYHFARQFKVATGFTCMQFLSAVRLSEAVKLLTSTGMRVSEVCYEVGFSDLTHFERRFKKDTGYTPTAFRRSFGRAAIKAENKAIPYE